MLVTEVNSFRSYHAALPLASILQTTIQHMACLTDYLTDRQLPLCKMAESEAERDPLLEQLLTKQTLIYPFC